MSKKAPVGTPKKGSKPKAVPIPQNAVSDEPVVGLPVGDVSPDGKYDQRPLRIKSEAAPTRSPIKKRNLKPMPKPMGPVIGNKELRKRLPSSPHSAPAKRSGIRELPTSPQPQPEERPKRELPTSPHKPPEMRSGRRTKPKLERI